MLPERHALHVLAMLALSSRARFAKLASQIRVALTRIESNTAFRSPCELLMTLSTSAVAVCCCSWNFAQLAEQPRILDGDDGLRGEILDQLDLLVGEWLHLLPIHINGADKLVVFEHWHRYKCPHACGFDKRNDAVVFSDVGRIGPEVGDVDNLLGIGDTIEGNSRIVFQLNHTITPPKIDVALLAMVDSYAAKITSLV